MSTNKDINFFPWELYFSNNENEIENAKKSCDGYPMATLRFAAQAVFEKSGKSKTSTCDNILAGIKKLVKKEVLSLKDKNEQELALTQLKKDIKQRFFTFLGIKQIASRASSPIRKIESENTKDKDVELTLKLFKYILQKGALYKVTFKGFRTDSKLESINEDELRKLYNAVLKLIKESTEQLSNEEKLAWIMEQIDDLSEDKKEVKKEVKKDDNKMKYIKKVLNKKGWAEGVKKDSSEEELDEILLDKLLDEEKEFKENESIVSQQLEHYKLLYDQTQAEINDQTQIIKQLKKDKKKSNELKEASDDLIQLKKT